MSKVAVAKRVEFASFGDEDVLEIAEFEPAHPGPGEVLVEVLAAGINHIEAEIRNGELEGRLTTSFPQTQGTDFAGTVLEVGAGVAGFKRHAEVVGHAGRSSHATHVVVTAKSLVRKPPHLSWEVAGALPLAGFTAWDVVEDLHVGAGDTVVVSAAAGGVGSIEVQLAKMRGAHVVGTCGERNFDYLRQLGVTPVVYGDGLADRIIKVAHSGVSAYIDNFGQDGEGLARELGVPDSRFRSASDRQELELKALDPDGEFGDHVTAVLEKLVVLAGERKLDILISGFFPFRLVRNAFHDLERLHARGKIVMGMHPALDDAPVRARELADERP
jgi:D-arabinose 1-dehydrogenase-like Zn-dependent alcohol dehydrogenase